MQPLSISQQDIIDEQKQTISDLQHQHLVDTLIIRKMKSIIEQYEAAAGEIEIVHANGVDILDAGPAGGGH